MRILLTRAGPESPFADVEIKSFRGIEDLPDAHGAFSVEDFAYTNDLKKTHDDADGWLDYLNKFRSKNFWYKDENVRNWAFYEQYDNWQDTYGIDAVVASYFASHGSMLSNGNFKACMGSDWGNKGHYAYSHDMRIGNEQGNYIWWSCCLSMRIFGGHSPIKTWAKAHQGFRMMFGYETTMVDDSDYGDDFWDEWNENKSLGRAFLDTSWDISSDQVPVVLAVGPNQQAAMDRLFNERKLSYSHEPNGNWFHWWWYEKANPNRRQPNRNPPPELKVAYLKRPRLDGRHVRSVLKKHKLEIPLPRQVKANLRGTFFLRREGISCAFRGDGTYGIEYSKPNLRNKRAIGAERAKEIARNFISQEKLERDVDLDFDFIRFARMNGGKQGGRPEDKPQTVETTVEFMQMVNETPSISPKAGRVRVTIDNDGRVTRLENRTRPVTGLSKRSKSVTSEPDLEPKAHALDAYKRLLDSQFKIWKKMQQAKGKQSIEMKILPDTDEFGYLVVGNRMALYARALVEVTGADGFSKRYYVSKPLIE